MRGKPLASKRWATSGSTPAVHVIATAPQTIDLVMKQSDIAKSIPFHLTPNPISISSDLRPSQQSHLNPTVDAPSIEELDKILKVISKLDEGGIARNQHS